MTIAKVDENRKPITGTEEFIECDTLLLSVGLIPENELSKKASVSIDRFTNGAVVDQNRQTSCDGIFACGNVLHVHDLVDFVSEEAEIAAMGAVNYIKNKTKEKISINIKTDGKIRYTVPQRITEKKDVTVYFRVSDVFKNVKICVSGGENVLFSTKKAKVSPGEMEKITLKSNSFENCAELNFYLEEV